MWTVAGGIPDPTANDPVAVIGVITALAVLGALVARAQGRRRGDGARSGYS